MADFKFGMTADPLGSNSNGDFVVLTPASGGNYNPYGTVYFDDPNHMVASNDMGRITSIPSPYARMLLTDIAFREFSCGVGNMTENERNNRKLSHDYLRAMSHCLDIYELLYYADQFDFVAKGITIQKINLVSLNTQDVDIQKKLKDDNGKLTDIGRYIETLDLFRNEYMAVIQKSLNGCNYLFDFQSLYLLKHRGKTFAATSPFTGFFAKADCDLSEANLVIDGQKRQLLSANPQSWCTISQRSATLKKFLYMLLKETLLCNVFKDFYESVRVELSQQEVQVYDGLKFNNEIEYKKFNLGTPPLQQVATKSGYGKPLYLRPDGLDCSYLKYLLYLSNTSQLTINPDEYATDIASRVFNGASLQWIGVNDILSDGLFMLTYEINDNYITIPYKDKDQREKKRCLLPIKQNALNYFTIDYLLDNNNISIEKRSDNVFVVVLRIALANGGYTILRREYTTEGKFPNGKIIRGEVMKPFAFGIYPFVKSNKFENIYKVLFYNAFDKDYTINFYEDQNGVYQNYLETSIQKNQTNSIKENVDTFPVNCEYYQLSSNNSLAFAEISYDNTYTSLIFPKLRDIKNIPGTVTVGIDVGTSNTYIAYTQEPLPGTPLQIKSICTHHEAGNNSPAWNELTFMNKRCEKSDDPSAPQKNRDDLYLQISDRADVRPSAEWLDSQLCEFIPSRIDPTLNNNHDDAYSFPIPSVLNLLRIDTQRVNPDGKNKLLPLLHYAIPFAYYERGLRKGPQPYYFDLVEDGKNFKWFTQIDDFGNITLDPVHQSCCKAYISELLFIVRSHLLCQGYDLNQTNILWSYPLSFSSPLISDYKKMWTELYKEIINPNPQANSIQYTSESRTPIFVCHKDPSSIDSFTLLLDIGGGSTDIIGYKNQKPQFVSSFEFAGNALYLDGGLNRVEPSMMENTLLMYYINQQPLIKEDNRDKTQKISCSDSISTIMNYGFAKDPDSFERIFQNEYPKFMLLFHNAAIIYHITQLCKTKFPNEMPAQVYLTGNGSKLFMLNSSYKGMIQDIINYVYKSDNKQDILVGTPMCDPKAATVEGALKGFSNKQLLMNDDTNSSKVIMLGDSSTIFEDVSEEGVPYNDESYKESVYQNVVDFVDMFYEKVYKKAKPAMEKEAIIKSLNNIKNQQRLNIPQNGFITDSFFFKYISLLMEHISIKLRENFD